jgi:hypothetical protein
MIPELEEILKVKIPTPYTSEGILATPFYLSMSKYYTETRQFLIRLCAEKGVICNPPQTTSRLLDKVFLFYYCFFFFWVVNDRLARRRVPRKPVY